jgi:hypothetical protein
MFLIRIQKNWVCRYMYHFFKCSFVFFRLFNALTFGLFVDFSTNWHSKCQFQLYDALCIKYKSAILSLSLQFVVFYSVCGFVFSKYCKYDKYVKCYLHYELTTWVQPLI